jgi:hypothetical protein
MADLLPDRPDPLDVLIPPLRRVGTSEAVIKAFVIHWRTLVSKATRLPCPLCYTRGGWGDLRPVEGRKDILYGCLLCNAMFWMDGTVTAA